ncbi:MAG: nitrate- and nitrite sensing domain-containing protein, partial [Chitinophagaceae bacterium]|nr:nitrate- and nitrite sensing domain-containing protein [Chitinophagaceae bacterium]
MKKLFTRIPLPAKLILTGLIPLVFVIYISIQLLSERTKKANLLRSYVDRIHQSADMTNLIDRLQGERNKTYEYALKKTGQPEMVAERRQTDSLIRRLQNYPFLSNFTDYTFLGNLDTVRNSIDSGKYAPNQVVHYYTTIIFRLNTLNPVPIGASIYVPEASHDINSQKLLSEIITYLGITSTNIYTALYTRAYVVETLVGSIGTYQVFNSYEKEFFVKARPIVIRSYKDIRESGALKETVTYLDTVFRTFVIDSTYTAANWKSVSDAAIEQLRQLQHGILQDVSQKVNEIYTDVQRAKDTSLALLAIALILVIAIIAYTIYSINDSLLKLKRDAEKISRGEPGVHINGVTNDVIGVLARSIRKIDQNNKVLAQAADAIGRGDFAVEVKPRSTNDELGNAILQMKKGLQQFTQDLAKSEKRNRQMLELLPAAVYSCGMDGHLKSYNKAAVELWGQEPDLSKDKWTGAFKTFNSDNILLTPDESPM